MVNGLDVRVIRSGRKNEKRAEGEGDTGHSAAGCVEDHTTGRRENPTTGGGAGGSSVGQGQ